VQCFLLLHLNSVNRSGETCLRCASNPFGSSLWRFHVLHEALKSPGTATILACLAGISFVCRIRSWRSRQLGDNWGDVSQQQQQFVCCSSKAITDYRKKLLSSVSWLLTGAGSGTCRTSWVSCICVWACPARPEQRWPLGMLKAPARHFRSILRLTETVCLIGFAAGESGVPMAMCVSVNNLLVLPRFSYHHACVVC